MKKTILFVFILALVLLIVSCNVENTDSPLEPRYDTKDQPNLTIPHSNRDNLINFNIIDSTDNDSLGILNDEPEDTSKTYPPK